MQIDTKEVLRYLAFRGEPEERLLQEIDICSRELLSTVMPKSCFLRVPVVHGENGQLEIAGTSLCSKDLQGHLRECTEAFLFAATLGAQVDNLMRRYSVTAMSRAVILQACAAAAIESFCDEQEEGLRKSVEEEKLFLRPRYSPGYGDFPIQWQHTLLSMLDAPKRIGLTATESCMLAPTKSVTAIIGLTHDETDCHIRKCMGCKSKNCPFRRDGDDTAGDTRESVAERENYPSRR